MITISGLYNNFLNNINETVWFEALTSISSPDTTVSDLSCIYDDGYNLPSNIMTFGTSYSAVFPIEGQYSMEVEILSGHNVNDTITVCVCAFAPFQITSYPDYDENKIRTYNVTELKLPYTLDDVLISPNDFGEIANIFNITIDKLEANLTYMENIGTIYLPPPFKYQGWLGNVWHIEYINNDNEVIGQEKYYTKQFDDVCIRNDGVIFVADNNSWSIYSAVSALNSNYRATPMVSIDATDIAENLFNIKSIQCDNNKNVYIMDNGISDRNPIIYVYNYDETRIANPLKFRYSWGGWGGLLANNKYRNPSAMKLNNDGTLWIVDTGNNCIKKNSSTGSWIYTLTSPYFAEESTELDKFYSVSDGAPIDVCIDNLQNIHVLTNKYVVKFDKDYNFITTYNWKVNGVAITDIPLKMISSKDNGIIYIMFNNKVLRISTYGINLGIIDNTLYGYEFANINFSGIFHDDHRNLYITSNKTNYNTLLKYVDTPQTETIYSTQIDYPWELNDIYIKSDEYVNDFVFNRSLQRYYDNLESFRQRIINKIQYIDGEYSITGFLEEDRLSFNYAKNEIYLGVNELFTADVVNREISKLYSCQETLFQMVSG